MTRVDLILQNLVPCQMQPTEQWRYGSTCVGNSVPFCRFLDKNKGKGEAPYTGLDRP